MGFLHYIFRKAGSASVRVGNSLHQIAFKIQQPELSLSDANKKEWYRIKGDETLRVRYALNESSVVFDVGGFRGHWCAEISARYACAMYVFEPVKDFYDFLHQRFEKNKKIRLFPFGLSGKDTDMEIAVMSESSSVFRDKNQRHNDTVKEKIILKDVNAFIRENNISKIDLIKINIEGGEYELLESLIASGFIADIENIQVQFHDFVENAEERMNALKKKLSETHQLTYEYIFVWENWERKH